MLQQEVRVRGPAAAGLVHRERLVEQEPARLQRPDQRREQRPVKVVHDDDEVVSGFSQRDVAGFEVEDFGGQLEPQLAGGRAQ